MDPRLNGQEFGEPRGGTMLANEELGGRLGPDTTTDRLQTELIETTTKNSQHGGKDTGMHIQDLSHELPIMNPTISSSGVSLPPPPDGGFRAWLSVFMGFICIFQTWGYVNSFGSFQAHYTEALPESASAIAWIGSVQVWLVFFAGAFSGRLLDAGYFRITFLVGSVLMLLGMFLMSISTQFWQLMLTQGILTGLGGGILFTPCLALVATYFDRKRALALGLLTTGNSLGGMVYPIVVRELLPRVGFGWTTRVLGFINLTGFTIVLAFLRARLPPRRAGPLIDWTAFKEPVWLAYVSGMFFLVWGLYYTLYFIASFAVQEVGVPYGDSLILVTIINGVGLPTRVLVPALAIYTGPLNCIIPGGLATALVGFTWLAVHDRAGLYGFTVGYGLVTGAFQSLMPTGLASITKRLDMVGTRLGMCFSIVSFAGLTGPPIGGALNTIHGMGFIPSQVWAAGVTLVGAALLTLSRVYKSGWGLTAKG